MLDKFSSPPYCTVKQNNFDNEITKSLDIRSPGCLKLAGRELSYRAKMVILVVLDSLALWVGWSMTSAFYLKTFDLQAVWQQPKISSLFITTLMFMIFLFFAWDLYRKGTKSRSLSNSIKAVFLAHIAILPIVWQFYEPNIIYQLILAFLLTTIIITSQRLMLNWIWAYVRQRHFPLRQKILLIGNQRELQRCEKLLENSEVFQTSGKLDLSNFEDDQSLSLALDQIDYRELDEVFICSWESVKGAASLYWKLRTIGVNWRIISVNIKLPDQQAEIATILGVPTIRFDHPAIIGIDFLSKRVFDIIVSLILLLIFGLPMLLISLLIKLDSPGSILYKQTRVGLKGNHFKIWKFRTMVENASELQQKLEAKNEIPGGILFKIKDDPRITRVGKYLRRYSLDEFPQLFNVLRGEMSLVGPRPFPVRDVAKFSQNHFFRQQVLPGITGLWQVSGRSNTDSDGVFNLDFEYIENWSLVLDFKILLQTIKVVFEAKGAY